MISGEEIEKLSALARIHITDGEKKKLSEDLEGILAYVSTLSQVETDTEAVETAPVRNVFREDAGEHDAGAYTKDLLASAPRAKNGYVIVKKILGA